VTALGAGVVLVGYWLAYFGWESIQGPGVGLLDLIVPGRLDAKSNAIQAEQAQVPVASGGGVGAPVPAGSKSGTASSTVGG
jgi:hypothetical protein